MPRVYLAVGHGRKPSGVWDPGAINAGVNLSEQTAGDVIIWTAAHDLLAVGFEVKHEARQDDPNWEGTWRLANAYRPDLVVAQHHDWSGGVDGAHGFWASTAGMTAGRHILDAVDRAGFKVRWDWFRERGGLGLLRNTDAPCFLFEAGRIGDKVLDETHELEAMGHALARGIGNYFGIDIDPAPEDVMDAAQEAKLDRGLAQIDQVLALLEQLPDTTRNAVTGAGIVTDERTGDRLSLGVALSRTYRRVTTLLAEVSDLTVDLDQADVAAIVAGIAEEVHTVVGASSLSTQDRAALLKELGERIADPSVGG